MDRIPSFKSHELWESSRHGIMGKRRDGRRGRRAGKSGGKKGGARWEERHGDEMRGERGTAKEVQKALAAIELNL